METYVQRSGIGTVPWREGKAKQIRANASKSDANLGRRNVQAWGRKERRGDGKMMPNVKETESNECADPEAVTGGNERANEY